MRFSALAFIFLFSACATQTHITGTAELPQLPAGRVGAAMPFSFKSSNILGDSGCNLVLRKDGELHTYEVQFKPGTDILFVELPPGNYAYTEVVCGGWHWNMSFKPWPRFQVVPNSISFVAGLKIDLDEDRKMSKKVTNRTSNRNDALSLLGRLPADDVKRVVSGYTGQPITSKNIEQPARWKEWELKDDSGKVLKAEKEDWPTFPACYKGEDQVNGIWLGNLKFNVSYQDGNLLKIDPVETWNTFTPHFQECVKAALGEFHPRKKSKISYTLYL